MVDMRRRDVLYYSYGCKVKTMSFERAGKSAPAITYLPIKLLIHEVDGRLFLGKPISSTFTANDNIIKEEEGVP